MCVLLCVSHSPPTGLPRYLSRFSHLPPSASKRNYIFIYCCNWLFTTLQANLLPNPAPELRSHCLASSTLSNPSSKPPKLLIVCLASQLSRVPFLISWQPSPLRLCYFSPSPLRTACCLSLLATTVPVLPSCHCQIHATPQLHTCCLLRFAMLVVDSVSSLPRSVCFAIASLPCPSAVTRMKQLLAPFSPECFAACCCCCLCLLNTTTSPTSSNFCPVCLCVCKHVLFEHGFL